MVSCDSVNQVQAQLAIQDSFEALFYIQDVLYMGVIHPQFAISNVCFCGCERKEYNPPVQKHANLLGPEIIADNS